jgi:hypothetical protein
MLHLISSIDCLPHKNESGQVSPSLLARLTAYTDDAAETNAAAGKFLVDIRY